MISRPETVLEGIGVSHGIAMGKVFIVAVERPQVQEEKMPQKRLKIASIIHL